MSPYVIYFAIIISVDIAYKNIVGRKSLSEIRFTVFFPHFLFQFFCRIKRYGSNSNGDIDSTGGHFCEVFC